MKSLVTAIALLALAPALSAQTAAPAADATKKAPAKKITSMSMRWEELVPNTPSKRGSGRQVFDGPSDTLDRYHLHMSMMNPGENTGALHRHPQEEMVIVKEGTIEVNIDGKKSVVNAGGIIFFGANENENMTNIGTTPATYYVIQWFTALTPKAVPAAPGAAAPAAPAAK